MAGATVVIRVRKHYPDSEQRPDVSFMSTYTDADGRWSFSNVPEKPDAFGVGTYHHLYLTDSRSSRWMTSNPCQPSATGRLSSCYGRVLRIDGSVLGPDGRPVPDAAVVYGEENFRAVNRIPPIKTDAHGRFILGITPGAISALTARCAGFGPAIQTIRVGTEPQRVALTLQPPHTLGGRVVDSAGRPIARATLSVQSWRGSESLEQEVTTDSDGRFLWKDAPGDEVRVRIYANGYVQMRRIPRSPGCTEPDRVGITDHRQGNGRRRRDRPTCIRLLALGGYGLECRRESHLAAGQRYGRAGQEVPRLV